MTKSHKLRGNRKLGSLAGIKQGAGYSVTKPFGVRKDKTKQSRKSNTRRAHGGGNSAAGSSTDVWNAFHPSHLALPRAVAPYTVIRTTAIWNPTVDNSRRFVMFGPEMASNADAGQWTHNFARGTNVALTESVGAANGVNVFSFGTMESDAWLASSVVPSAFSIQVMNPEAIQGSTGMVYIGRTKQKVHLAEGSLQRTFEDVANDLVSYSQPRLCSAGKLALRGVQVDAVPNNMSELAKFTTLNTASNSPITLSPTNTVHQEGFNPIFIYNPNAVDLQVLVCCEWRVRFDPSNPAYDACTLKKPATDVNWYSTLQRTVATGAGVIDIVEKIADMGRAASAAAPMLV